MISNYSKIVEFHRVFGRTPDPETPTVTCETSRLLRAKLIWEEMNELFEELGIKLSTYEQFGKEGSWFKIVPELIPNHEVDLIKVAKETADLLYVTYGTAASMGLPIDKVYDAVHESNMSKRNADGSVSRREDGKVLKSDLYREPNIKELL